MAAKSTGSIGYACLTVAEPGTRFRNCRIANATAQNLRRLVSDNLLSLKKIFHYNIRNNIRLFRISSDIIPYAGHPIDTVLWQSEFSCHLEELGRIITDNALRVSMHPGQYTVLNSPKSAVVNAARADLQYHAGFLDALGVGCEHKIVLHIGGGYGDKPVAMQRFIESFSELPANVRRRLVIENDDKVYTIADVLAIATQITAPVVFDSLHHEINHPVKNATDAVWINRCRATWTAVDDRQKIHYSQQQAGGRAGSHSQTIDVEQFMQYYDHLPEKAVDIMLEVKDKNISAVNCITALNARINNRG